MTLKRRGDFKIPQFYECPPTMKESEWRDECCQNSLHGFYEMQWNVMEKFLGNQRKLLQKR